MTTENAAGFQGLGLHENVQRAVTDLGWTTPSPIQARAVPVIMKGRDVIGLAQTGTGKTGAFLLPVLHRLAEEVAGEPAPRGEPVAPDGRRRVPKWVAVPRSALPVRKTRVLVLTPTRELALQVQAQADELGRHFRNGAGVTTIAVIGGVGFDPQISALRSGVDIVVACPGRLLDLLNRGQGDFGGLTDLVLDEADRMMDMGFLPDVRRVLAALPPAGKRRTLMFSATMPPELQRLAGEMLRDPELVEVGSRVRPPDTIKHGLYPVPTPLKQRLLEGIIAASPERTTLVFVRTRRRAERVATTLSRACRVARMHGDRSQGQRVAALEAFRSGRCPVLIATDIAARGIDVDNIGLVVNFDVPVTPEDYLHRIGRTGRAMSVGEAVTFADPGEEGLVRAIERVLAKRLPRLTVPAEVADGAAEFAAAPRIRGLDIDEGADAGDDEEAVPPMHAAAPGPHAGRPRFGKVVARPSLRSPMVMTAGPGGLRRADSAAGPLRRPHAAARLKTVVQFADGTRSVIGGDQADVPAAAAIETSVAARPGTAAAGSEPATHRATLISGDVGPHRGTGEAGPADRAPGVSAAVAGRAPYATDSASDPRPVSPDRFDGVGEAGGVVATTLSAEAVHVAPLRTGVDESVDRSVAAPAADIAVVTADEVARPAAGTPAIAATPVVTGDVSVAPVAAAPDAPTPDAPTSDAATSGTSTSVAGGPDAEPVPLPLAPDDDRIYSRDQQAARPRTGPRPGRERYAAKKAAELGLPAPAPRFRPSVRNGFAAPAAKRPKFAMPAVPASADEARAALTEAKSLAAAPVAEPSAEDAAPPVAAPSNSAAGRTTGPRPPMPGPGSARPFPAKPAAGKPWDRPAPRKPWGKPFPPAGPDGAKPGFRSGPRFGPHARPHGEGHPGPRPFGPRPSGPDRFGPGDSADPRRRVRGEGPRFERPAPGGDAGSEGERPHGERRFGPRPFAPKPFGPRPFAPKPFGSRPTGPRVRGQGPYGPRPTGPDFGQDRVRFERPVRPDQVAGGEGGPAQSRPQGDRPFAARPAAGKPFGLRPAGPGNFAPRSGGGKTFGPRPFGPRPSGPGSFAPRPAGPAATGPRPWGAKPGKPFGSKPFPARTGRPFTAKTATGEAIGKSGAGKPAGGNAGAGEPAAAATEA